MKQRYCYIIDKNGKPLAPTKKWDMVYRKLRNGTAKIVRKKPFAVQFLDKQISDEKVTESTLCLDPGRTTGIAVIKNDTNEVVFLAEVEINAHKIAERVKKRKLYRNLRKKYQRQKRIRRALKYGTYFEGIREFKFPKMESGIKCKYIRPKSPRYLNRKRKFKHSPTVEYFKHSMIRVIKDISRFIAINRIVIEFVPFDIRKLREPYIKSFWYQVSNKKGFSRWTEYIKYRDNYTCTRCGKNEDLEVHHIRPRSKGGSDNPRNMVTLCSACHAIIHTDRDQFQKWSRKFQSYIQKVEKKTIKDDNVKYASYMNQAINDIVKILHNNGFEIELISPEIVRDNRACLGLGKTHVNDAISMYGKNVNIKFNDLKIFNIKQFNKHNRYFTMGIDDRMYCFVENPKKPIAFNRKPRIEQDKPSVFDLVKKYGKLITGKLRVYRKGGSRIRLNNQKYFPGDTISYYKNDEICSGVVLIVRNRHKRIKLHNGIEISFKSVISKICKRILLYM